MRSSNLFGRGSCKHKRTSNNPTKIWADYWTVHDMVVAAAILEKRPAKVETLVKTS